MTARFTNVVVPEHVLQNTPHRQVVRVGDIVRRPLTPWSAAVHQLLLHLETVGYPYSPRFRGIDEQRREVLSFIPGTSGADGFREGSAQGGDSWAKIVPADGLRRFARFLREYHDAVASFAPTAGAVWVTGAASPGPADIICHGDFGPWNVIWQQDHPVGLIDWDFAQPGPARNDVADALRFAAPFVGDDQAVGWMRYPGPPCRGRRIGMFLAAYGDGGGNSGAAVPDEAIAGLDRTAGLVSRLANAGHEPQVTWVAKGWLDRLREQAAWIDQHRELFDPPGR